MKLVFKAFGIAFVFAGLCVLLFMLSGEALETLFNHQACAEWLSRMKTFGWLFGIFLLVSDILLPIPATGIMSALGDVYGFWIGWLSGTVGSLSAGFLGYGLARLGRERVADWLASPEELDRFRSFFDHWGGAGIIVSRILPILPEVMSVLAGLARMRLIHFSAALFLGTVPVTALFSWWGDYAGGKAPVAAHTAAILLPLVLWPMVLLVLRRYQPNQLHASIVVPDFRTKC